MSQPSGATACSRCLAPLPAGEPGAVLTCPYCGQQTRVPVPEGVLQIPGLPIMVVGSSRSLAERMEATRAANQKLQDDERRRALLVMIPIFIVAIAAGVFAILSQSGVFDASPPARRPPASGARAR